MLLLAFLEKSITFIMMFNLSFIAAKEYFLIVMHTTENGPSDDGSRYNLQPPGNLCT